METYALKRSKEQKHDNEKCGEHFIGSQPFMRHPVIK